MADTRMILCSLVWPKMAALLSTAPRNARDLSSPPAMTTPLTWGSVVELLHSCCKHLWPCFVSDVKN